MSKKKRKKNRQMGFQQSYGEWRPCTAYMVPSLPDWGICGKDSWQSHADIEAGVPTTCIKHRETKK